MFSEFQIPMPNRARTSHPNRAFSLIELIAVMAIIVIMMGLLAPALSSFTSTYGRKAAVTTLMNTFEQARVAAIETGSDVTVLLRRSVHPDQDAVMVVRERLPWDDQTLPPVIQLSKWLPLPEGILFFTQGNTLVEDSTPPKPITFPTTFTPPGTDSTDIISYLQFNPSGVIQFPQGDKLRLFVTEGVRDGGGNEARIGATKQSSTLERLQFARFTGRAALDVTSTSN